MKSLNGRKNCSNQPHTHPNERKKEEMVSEKSNSKMKSTEKSKEKCTIPPLPNSDVIKGVWSDLKQKFRSALDTLKTKQGEIITSGPIATSTPASRTSSVVTAIALPEASPIAKNPLDFSSDSSFKGSPKNISFKDDEEGRKEESQATQTQHLLEYVLKNIKSNERVSGIQISIERRFTEI